MKKKRGRPPVPPAERRERDVRVSVSEAEGAALDAWAAREGRPLAALLRELGLRRARRA